MKTLKTIVTLVVLAILVLGVIVATGAYNFAADQPHWRVTELLIDFAKRRSIALRAQDVRVPTNLDRPERLVRGAEHYDAMCAGCHLAPGSGDNEFRQAMYPRPPDLVEHGAEKPAHAFWVIKHGIKMSGMPAWGTGHDDKAIWDIVALVKALPNMTSEQYQGLVAEAKRDEETAGHDHGSHEH